MQGIREQSRINGLGNIGVATRKGERSTDLATERRIHANHRDQVHRRAERAAEDELRAEDRVRGAHSLRG